MASSALAVSHPGAPLTGTVVPPRLHVERGGGEDLGLTSREAARRLSRHGPNDTGAERYGSLWSWLRLAGDPMTLLLLIAGVAYLALDDAFNAVVVLVAVLPIAFVSILLNARSDRALARLRTLVTPSIQTWRDGRHIGLPAAHLVPGDAILVHDGDVVPTDGLLIGGTPLLLNEEALTGDATPVERVATAGDTAGRRIRAGTSVLSGRGIVIVTATGARTEHGRVAAQQAIRRLPQTRLERETGHVVSVMGGLALVACLAVVYAQIARGFSLATAVIAGVTLAIAAVPEEFPMVLTLYLSAGAWRLARAGAVVRRLAGVERLGATTVICTDKTGTLTLGHVVTANAYDARQGAEVSTIAYGDLRRLATAAVLATDPHPSDSLERATIDFARQYRVDVAALHGRPLVRQSPFDPRGRTVTRTWHMPDGSVGVYAKGAVDGVLARCADDSSVKARVRQAARAMTAQGLRVIAFASGAMEERSDGPEPGEPPLFIEGVIGFADPLRPGVVEAVRTCREETGVRVLLLTGDSPVTASLVAEAVGLPFGTDDVITGDAVESADDATLRSIVSRATVFARVTPEQKSRIVRALRANGEVVAMTGDRVSDAPALRASDIGIALANTRAAVTRDAAEALLLDGSFATIAGAVRNGRRIDHNLAHAFAYIVAFHIPLLLSAIAAPLLGVPLFLLPVHLVWLELVEQPTSSLVFEGDTTTGTMARRPSVHGRFAPFPLRRFLRPALTGGSLTLGVFGLYLAQLSTGTPVAVARSAALVALILGQSLVILTERSPEVPLWRGGQPETLWRPALAMGGALLTLVLVVCVPSLASILQLGALAPAQWGVAAVVGLVSVGWVELLKPILSRWRGWQERMAMGRVHVEAAHA